MSCIDRLCGCPLQDGETLEYMLAWIQEEPLKGGILFIVSPCSPALELQCHIRACARLLHAIFRGYSCRLGSLDVYSWD